MPFIHHTPQSLQPVKDKVSAPAPQATQCMASEQQCRVLWWTTPPTDCFLTQRKVQKTTKSMTAKIFLGTGNIFCQGNVPVLRVAPSSQHSLLAVKYWKRDMENIINPVFFTQLLLMLFYFYSFSCFYETIINLLSEGRARIFFLLCAP